MDAELVKQVHAMRLHLEGAVSAAAAATVAAAVGAAPNQYLGMIILTVLACVCVFLMLMAVLLLYMVWFATVAEDKRLKESCLPRAHQLSKCSVGSQADIQLPTMLLPKRDDPIVSLSDAGSFEMVYSREENVPIAQFRNDWTCDTSSAGSSDSLALLPSEISSSTVLSVASAPARLSQHRCFLPRTRFQRPARQGGGFLTAAEMRCNGGDTVLGPSGTEVLVHKAIRHPAEERDCVHFCMDGVDQPFMVTADHTLTMQAPNLQQVAEEAKVLAGNPTFESRHVFDGQCFRKVTSAKVFPMLTEVVEVTFVDNAIVMAWVPRGRRPRSGGPKSASTEHAVACHGAPMSSQDVMQRLQVSMKNTFISCSHTTSLRRSLSVGDRPRSPSWFSLGTRTHKQSDPSRCDVCKIHHRHLLDTSKPACRNGDGCPRCHMPHEELRWRF